MDYFLLRPVCRKRFGCTNTGIRYLRDHRFPLPLHGALYAIHRAWRVRLCLRLVRKSLEHNLPYTNLQELIEPDYGNPPDFKHPAKAGLIGLITYIPCIFLSWTALGLFMSSFVLKLILAIIIGFVVSFIIGLVTTKLAAEKEY